MRNVLWYLIAGTRGGYTRGRVIALLNEQPSNANRIAELLYLDYKTVRHHLNVLEKNNIVTVVAKEKYGAVYFLSDLMNVNMGSFAEIWNKIGRDLGKR